MNILSINKMIKKKLKERARSLEPIIRIGKNGLTIGLINEIKRQLKKKKLVKIKLFKNFLRNKDKKLIAKEIAEKTNSILIEWVGFVVVLYKK